MMVSRYEIEQDAKLDIERYAAQLRNEEMRRIGNAIARAVHGYARRLGAALLSGLNTTSERLHQLLTINAH